MKYYTPQWIEKEFSKMNRIKKIEILLDALDCMQQYNGRSKMDCVILAMGYDYIEDANGKQYFKKHD
jgi:hypothetical protein